MSKNERVLVISDLHIPYHHADSFKFLKAIKEKYKPDLVICIGDESDWHSISFHPKDPDLANPFQELNLARIHFKVLSNMFPEMDILESNHGSLIMRKILYAGLPRAIMRSYDEILGVPKTWRWHFELIIELSNGQKCFFHHGKSAVEGKLSRNISMNAVQGHFHTKFHITYWSNPTGIFFDAHCGYLADHRSIAQDYNKNNVERGVHGCLIILDGYPRLLPMVLDGSHRWIKKLV